jgi:hypothetical protein
LDKYHPDLYLTQGKKKGKKKKKVIYR